MPSPRRGAAIAALALAVVLAALLAWLKTLTPSSGAAGAPPVQTDTDTAATARAEPAAEAPPSRLPIRLPPTSAAPDTARARFEGRVVSTATGAGVPGADLTFSRAGAAASVRAGSDGLFAFEPPADGRWLLAAVTAEGFLPFAPEWGHSPVQLDARAGHPVRGLEIHLAPADALTGRVIDREGAPVADAEVRLLGAAAEAALVPIADRFTSDARGEFRFAAPQGATLEARKEGFLPGRADLDWAAVVNGRVTLRLGPAHRPLGPRGPVEGRVVAKGGAPVPGALVIAAPEGPFGGEGGVAAQAVADEDGRFALAELDAGSYRITARAEGRAPASARRVRPGATDVLLELGEGGRLRGCVSDAASGAPVAPFNVLVFERRTALRLVPQRSRSVIDPSGCYALDDLRPGPAVVVVTAPGYAPSGELRLEVPAPPGEAVQDAVLELGGRVTGVVREDATGAPIAGARISVEGALDSAASTFPVLAEATTGPDGRFTLSGLPRRASLFFAAAGHHARVVGVDVPPSGGGAELEVRLRPTADGEEPRVDLAGIGIVLAARGEALAVVQVVPTGGAAEAGLVRGDLVLRIEGTAVTELGFARAVDAIRGPEGTMVLLSVRRGDTMFDVRVPRRLVRG